MPSFAFTRVVDIEADTGLSVFGSLGRLLPLRSAGWPTRQSLHRWFRPFQPSDDGLGEQPFEGDVEVRRFSPPMENSWQLRVGPCINWVAVPSTRPLASATTQFNGATSMELEGKTIIITGTSSESVQPQHFCSLLKVQMWFWALVVRRNSRGGRIKRSSSTKN